MKKVQCATMVVMLTWGGFAGASAPVGRYNVIEYAPGRLLVVHAAGG